MCCYCDKLKSSGVIAISGEENDQKVVVNLERGKPRDLRGIENIYMGGNDRIYVSMGPKVFDMYQKAKAYKENKTESGETDTEIEPDATTSYDTKTQTTVKKPANASYRNNPSPEGIQESENEAPTSDTNEVSNNAGVANIMNSMKDSMNNLTPPDVQRRMRQEQNEKMIKSLGSSGNVLKKFFGTDDVYAIETSAKEIEYGNSKPSEKSSESK